MAFDSLAHRHLLVSALVGVGAVAVVWIYYAGTPGAYSDFDLIWYGARDLLAGKNPYHTLADYRWPPYYPLPAFLLGIPFAPLSLMAGRCAFAFVSASVATWAVLRHHRLALPLLLVSGPFVYALQRGQWSPLILAACLIPAWGFIVAAKPTTGFGAIVYRPTRVALIGAGALVLLSLAIIPGWPLDWFMVLGEQRHIRSPLLLPGGFLLLAVLLRWRRPEARLFFILTAAPQTIVPYELVPLAIVPRSRWEMLLVVDAWLVVYLVKVLKNPAPLLSHASLPQDYFPHLWWPMFILGYLPILVLILRRPNTGPGPAEYSQVGASKTPGSQS